MGDPSLGRHLEVEALRHRTERPGGDLGWADLGGVEHIIWTCSAKGPRGVDPERRPRGHSPVTDTPLIHHAFREDHEQTSV